jgi:hypothetical protein
VVQDIFKVKPQTNRNMGNYKTALNNLKKRGADANPNGRPKKGYSITEYFKEMLASNPEVKESIAKSIIAKALEGDTAAQKMVWQYMDGMPEQSINNKGKLEVTYKPIMGATANVPGNPGISETPEAEEEN